MGPFVGDGGGGAFAHDGAADFVDDGAALLDGFLGVVDFGCAGEACAHGVEDGGDGFLLVGDLFEFVIGEFPVEAKDGDAPLVDDIGIEFGVAVVVGVHGALGADALEGAVVAAGVILELFAEGDAIGLGDGVELFGGVEAGHFAAGDGEQFITAGEVEFSVLQVFAAPEGGVGLLADDAVLVVDGEVFEGGDLGAEAAGDGVGDVFADEAVIIAEAVGEAVGFGIEEEADGFL